HFAGRIDRPLPLAASGTTDLRYCKAPAACFERGVRGSRLKIGLHSDADWLRYPRVSFSISHLGSASLRLGTGSGRDVARRCPEEVRTLRSFESRAANDAGGRAVLGVAAAHSARRKHSLRRTGDDFAEAARSHARILQRDAHGVYIPRNRELQRHRLEWRRSANAGSRPLDRRALRDVRRTPQTDRYA